MKIKAFKVQKSQGSIPSYARRAFAISHIAEFVDEEKKGFAIGLALFRGGEHVAFRWGENLSLEEVRNMRSKDKMQMFVYIGRVWDAGKSRDNFARVASIVKLGRI